jgi:mRNA-degrading endonuclease RelE of RelBE toxin-antitoxin system
MYEIKYSTDALEDLRSFRKHEQNIIIDAIDAQLVYEPIIETSNRFRRDPPEIALWELRVGVFRVFYNVDDHVAIVRVERIGYKPNNTIFFRKRRGGR